MVYYHFSCVVESKDFHNKSSDEDLPFLYCVLKMADDQVPIPNFLEKHVVNFFLLNRCFPVHQPSGAI